MKGSFDLIALIFSVFSPTDEKQNCLLEGIGIQIPLFPESGIGSVKNVSQFHNCMKAGVFT